MTGAATKTRRVRGPGGFSNGFLATLFAVYLILVVRTEAGNSAITSGVYDLCALVALRATWKARRLPGLFPWLAAAIAFWAVGDIIWDFRNVYIGEPPYPSISDWLYLAYFIPLAIGLYVLSGRRFRLIGDGLCVAAAVFAFGWWAFAADLFTATSGVSVATRIVALGLAAGDTAVLWATSVTYIVWYRDRPYPLQLLQAAFMFFVGGDFIYSAASSRDIFDAGGLSDVLLAGGYLLVAAAVSHPDVVQVTPSALLGRSGMGLGKWWRLALAVGTATLTMLASVFNDDPTTRWGLIAATVIVAVGVVWPQPTQAPFGTLEAGNILHFRRRHGDDNGDGS